MSFSAMTHIPTLVRVYVYILPNEAYDAEILGHNLMHYQIIFDGQVHSKTQPLFPKGVVIFPGGRA